MMTERTVEFDRNIFVDTNSLIHMNSYLRMAKAHSLPPAAGGMDYEQVKDKLGSVFPRKAVDYYLRGARSLAYLQQEMTQTETTNARVNASRMSTAEMLYGRIEGEAQTKLAQQGIPPRARQSARDRTELVRHYLDDTTRQNVLQEAQQLFDDLSTNAGIQVNFAEDGDEVREIALLAEVMLGQTFMDILDSWIYAGAVMVQAEILVTFDEDFRKVVNKLRNPSADPWWETVRDEFMSVVKEKVFPVEVGKVPLELPLGFRPEAAVPEPW